MNKPWEEPLYSERKRRVLAAAHEYLIPGRIEAFHGMGLSLIHI